MPKVEQVDPEPLPDRTLLQYVAESYMGPPLRDAQPGESYWPCPRCDSPKWHTMPHREGCKDRFRCWSCQYRGDLDDLLAWHMSRSMYGERCDRVAQLRAEWEG